MHVTEDAGTDASSDVAVESNTGPIANAGLDASRLIGATSRLDGSGSTDPDGTLVSFQWSVESAPAGSNASIVGASSAIASFVADKVGIYTFALVVTDDDGATDRDTVTVTIGRGAFSVDAGPDKTLRWREGVVVTASYVSEAGPITGVSWSVLSRPPSTGTTPMPADSLSPGFYGERPGTYVAQLQITGPAGVATDTVTFTVVPPEPQLIDGDIVDIDTGNFGIVFAIASINPPRIRILEPRWPPSIQSPEMVIPLTIAPQAIGLSETGEYVSVIHDSTRVTSVSVARSAQEGTFDIGVPLLDVRHGSSTPRVYPAQAGQLTLVDHYFNMLYPGGAVPGPSRGRESFTGNRALYALVLGTSPSLRRYDANENATPFVRAWPYASGQYPLGSDLWLYNDKLITSSGHVFHVNDDPSTDMTHRLLLDGDQPFEIVSVAATDYHLVILADRVTTPPALPETQLRFYDPITLALEHVIPVPDVTVSGVPQRVVGQALLTTVAPWAVFVIGSAGTQYALLTIVEPPP